MNVNNFLRVASLAVVASMSGAAQTPASAQAAPAPKMNVGDKWVYNVKSGVGISPITYQETREVTAVSGGGAKVKVTGKTADGKDFSRVEDYSGPGLLRSGALCIDQAYRFPTPLQRVAFPLAPGQRSSKWVDAIGNAGGGKGQINYSVPHAKLGQANRARRELRRHPRRRADDPRRFHAIPQRDHL